jgi:transglutaminase-like putative cysteine protease
MLKRQRRVAYVLSVILLLSMFSNYAQALTLDESQLLHYRRINRIHNQGVEVAYDLVLTILLYPIVILGNQLTYEEVITPEPYEFFQDASGNRYAKISIPKLESGESIDVLYEANISNEKWVTDKRELWALSQQLHQEDINMDPGNEDFTDPAWLPYLEDEVYVSVSHPGIQDLAHNLTLNAIGPYDKAQRIFDYVNTNMNYDDSTLFARKGSVSALYNLKGICTDFASLMVALLRAARIPARMVGGYLFDENILDLTQQSWNGNEIAHAWVEFYMPGFGWIPADPTHIYYLNNIRVPARQSFAAQPNWGHVVSSYGIEASTYTLQSNHLGGALLQVTSSDQFFPGHRQLTADIDVFINQNQRVAFQDAKPIIAENNRTFVPMRDIFQALGATVFWNAQQQSVTAYRQTKVIVLKIGESTIWIDSVAYPIDSRPYLDTVNWRTMIPLRAVSEAFGADVQWRETTRDIVIWLEN